MLDVLYKTKVHLRAKPGNNTMLQNVHENWTGMGRSDRVNYTDLSKSHRFL